MKQDKLIRNVCLFVIVSITSLAEPSLGKENKLSVAPSRAENLFQSGKYREAIKIYDRIIPSLSEEERGIAYYNLAVAQNRIGSKISAIQSLQKATPLLKEISTEKYIVANLFLSQLYLDKGILFEVEFLLESTIALARVGNSSNLEAIGRALLGNLNLRLDRYEEAIKQYRSSWEIAKNPITLISLSQALWEKTDETAAVIEATKDNLERERLKQSIARDLEEGYQRAKQAISISQSTEERITARINLLKYFPQFLTRSELAKYRNKAIDLS